MSEHRWTLQRWASEAEANLKEWDESGGSLVATEPDAEQRAMIRIQLRSQIYTLRRAIGEEVKAADFEDADCRDLHRIRDAAIRDYIESRA